MPVFFPSQIDSEGNFPISPQDLTHLTKVLRVGPGKCFEVILPTGEKARAQLFREGKSWKGKIRERLQREVPRPLPAWLGLGWIRWPRLEWIVEKAVELGAARLTPLALRRSERLPKAGDVPKKLERLRKIAVETLKQCERAELPRLDPPQTLQEFLAAVEKEAPVSAEKIFFWERKDAPRFSPRNLPRPGPELWIVAVGPEGGWEKTELQVLHEHQFKGYSLGSSVYRTETSALYSLCALDFFIGSS
jgi:16S rRNA (uracil1498-N3)-methyltransferase